jgi:hypothetical protein
MLSHYREKLRLGTTKIDDICLPCGIEPIYFDAEDSFALQTVNLSPTFGPKLRPRVSSESPFSFINTDEEFALDSKGASSNKIISSQSQCPSRLGIHEFLSVQSLASARSLRWHLLLAELGSSNVNFSVEACAGLIAKLAILSGPSAPGDGVHRTVHREFLDASFCEQALLQISSRLRLIEHNWRESHCMGMLVTLILHILVVCPTSIAAKALLVLELARSYLAKWIKALLIEARQVTSLSATRQCSQFMLWAALLCRRTFQVCDKSNLDSSSHTGRLDSLDDSALRIYVLATVSFQQSIKELSTSLSVALREAVLEDIILLAKLEPVIAEAFRQHPQAVSTALNELGITPKTGVPQSARILPKPNDVWFEVILAPVCSWIRTQKLHFQMLAGHVLIDGAPQGKMADNLRNSPILDELFGNANLYVVSSGIKGMTYQLNVQFFDNTIHVGMRDGRVIVRVCDNTTMWEILDRRIFHPNKQVLGDLPHSLIYDCMQFFDLQAGKVEFRRKAANLWISFPTDWRLDLSKWRLTRSTKSADFTLVNFCGRFYDGK